MSFLNISTYSPLRVIFMNSLDMSLKKKMRLYLENILFLVIMNIEPTNVVQFIIDNASNFESAGDMNFGTSTYIKQGVLIIEFNCC